MPEVPRNIPEVLGLDIGGANLKAASAAGQAVTLPFPLWKQPEKLAGGLMELLVRLPHRGPVAITMTGELCDCFASKAAGVRHILTAVQEVFPEGPVFVWRNDAKWAGLQHAMEDPLPVASANWLASATFAARYLPQGAGWFFDLGSTTLDLIPLADGKVTSVSKTDLDRLQAGELAYLGASRTPVCSLVTYVDVNRKKLSVATEWFASLDDVLLVLDQATEDLHDKNTADGQPRTRACARKRVARMVCAEPDELGSDALHAICREVLAAYHERLHELLLRPFAQQNRWGGVILSGSGEHLLANVLHRLDLEARPLISLSQQLGPDLSTALAAYAVATLLAERQAR
ncbi:MAG: hydantoinase/oxoprolinase family protein [Gemmatales bacterium]